MRTHLSSHVPSGTQQPTEHTLVSAGQFEVEPAVSNSSWTETIIVREVLGLPRTPREGHVKLPTLLLQRLRGSQDMGLSSSGQTRPVGPRLLTTRCDTWELFPKPRLLGLEKCSVSWVS